MKNIVPFSFENNSIRTVAKNNEVWFVAADVCEILGIGNPTKALYALDDDEKAALTLSKVRSKKNGVEQDREFNIINESGLYALVLRSRKTAAKRFRKWVTSEVLPSIRRTGEYRSSPEWRQARIEGKTGRRVLTDAIRIFIDYAREQGSKSPERYYVNYTCMIRSFVSKEWRDDMPAHALVQMNAAEQVAAGIIMEGMEKDLFYREIFQSVKPVLDNMLRLWNLPKVRFLEVAA